MSFDGDRIQAAFGYAGRGTVGQVLAVLNSAYAAGHRGFRPDGTLVTDRERAAHYDRYLAVKARHEQRHAPAGSDVRGIVQNTLTTAGGVPAWWG